MTSYKPEMIMIALEFTYTGLALFTKGAFMGGMSPYVFVVYRQAIATLIMLPLAFFSNRRNPTGVSLTLESFSWILAASLFGYMVTANQNAYFQGINLASSTAATAIINLIPAFTFVFAAILGMEKVNIRSLRSGAKIFGTVICVGGAMAMAFTKGPKLLNSFQFLGSETDDDDNNWLMGCLILFASSVLWSLWIILQGVSLALTFLGQAWCVGERGPVFPAIFDPLCTVITAIFATIFLHEQTYMGGLIGAVVVIMGLYLVLWGKAEDMKEKGLVTDVEEPFLCNKPILV
ncbi:WAT1-related protein At4g28040 [Linum grandiflorum]